MILDRVKIMRVFDFEGVREAAEEVSGGLARVQEDEVETNNAFDGAGGEEEAKKNAVQDEPLKTEKAKRTYVPDSEDEDEDEDEMLFETENITATAALAQTIAPVTDPEPTPKLLEQDRGAIKFVLIDNLAHVISPLLKKDFIQGTSPLIPPSPA